MTKFQELPLSVQLQSNLAKLNYNEPTPIQAQAIEPALAGRDLVATAQTGTGKTLAFVLPTIQLLLNQGPQPGIRCVILTPTRELALQIAEAIGKIARGTGIRAAVVVGGMNERAQLKQIRKGAQVVVATPGRLYDFLSRRLVKLSDVKILVLDEADRMLDMGFLPTIKRIMSAIPAERQTLFFSATIETSVKHLVEIPRTQRRCASNSAPSPSPSEQVDLHLYEVDQDRKLGLLESMLERGAGLVPGLRAHQARRRATGQEALAERRQERRHPWRPQPEPAQPGAQRFPGWLLSRAGRHRRRRPRHPRGRHRARGELRSAAGARRLHPPRGPHRPRRSPRRRFHLRHRAASAPISDASSARCRSN